MAPAISTRRSSPRLQKLNDEKAKCPRSGSQDQIPINQSKKKKLRLSNGDDNVDVNSNGAHMADMEHAAFFLSNEYEQDRVFDSANWYRELKQIIGDTLREILSKEKIILLRAPVVSMGSRKVEKKKEKYVKVINGVHVAVDAVVAAPVKQSKKKMKLEIDDGSSSRARVADMELNTDKTGNLQLLPSSSQPKTNKTGGGPRLQQLEQSQNEYIPRLTRLASQQKETSSSKQSRQLEQFQNEYTPWLTRLASRQKETSSSKSQQLEQAQNEYTPRLTRLASRHKETSSSKQSRQLEQSQNEYTPRLTRLASRQKETSSNKQSQQLEQSQNEHTPRLTRLASQQKETSSSKQSQQLEQYLNEYTPRLTRLASRQKEMSSSKESEGEIVVEKVTSKRLPPISIKEDIQKKVTGTRRDEVQFSGGRIPNSVSEIRRLVCEDITGGLEDIPIPATNLVDDPPVAPTGFTYCKSNQVAKSVKLPMNAIGCDCKGRCTDSRKCACAKLNGSDFPYVPHNGGRLIEPKAIVFECNPNCGCGPGCVNRTSQRGMRYRLECLEVGFPFGGANRYIGQFTNVFRTPKKGWGVRSWDSIPSGAPVCEYIGVLMRTDEIDTTHENFYMFDIDCLETMKGLDGREKRFVDVSLPKHLRKDGNLPDSTPEFCIDASTNGNIARFINHSCEPNLFVQCVLSSHHDIRLARVVLFAADDIPPLQELTYDYGYILDSVKGPNGKPKQVACYCGEENCRKRLI